MNNTDLKNMYNFFEGYVSKFYTGDADVQRNIRLKEEHTKRVVEDAEIIADSINLSEYDKNIVCASALFHDIGRFEQFKRYNTFDDGISEDHAALGVKVLKDTKALNEIDNDEADMIIEAVRCHNMYRIPKQKNEKYLMLVKIIRDADKLDIYKVFADYFRTMDSDPNPAVEHNLPDNGEYNPQIVNDILNCKNSDSKLMRSRYDMRLQTLTWVYDINYKKTYELIAKRKYIENTMNYLPKNKDMEEVKITLIKYIESKIK